MWISLLTGFVAPNPNPPLETRRGHWVHLYARNERYDPLYSHPRDVPEDTPWEDKITMLTMEEMKDHSSRLQIELESSNLSFCTQEYLQTIFPNLNSLIKTYLGVGPSTHIFHDMMRRRRFSMMGRHKFEEVKKVVTKEMVFSCFDLRPGDKKHHHKIQWSFDCTAHLFEVLVFIREVPK